MISMMAYPHPNQVSQQHGHPGFQQGAPQHIQGPQGQPGQMSLQQQQAYQQHMNQPGGVANRMSIPQQAMYMRQQQQQMLGMGFQNPNGVPAGAGGGQMGMPNGVYSGGTPGGGMQFGMNPRQMLPQHIQQQQRENAQRDSIIRQRDQIAVAQQLAAAQMTQAQAQQTAQASAHAPQMNMPQQFNPANMTPQHLAQLQQNQVAAQARQRQAMATSTVKFRLHQFADNLAEFSGFKDVNHIDRWKKFVDSFYSEIGALRHLLVHRSQEDSKQFEISNQLLARYYFTLFDSGIKNIQFQFSQLREREIPSGRYAECANSTFTYWYSDGCHLVARGTLRVTFNSQSMIDLLDFQTKEQDEYISRNSINAVLMSPSESPELSKSPAAKMKRTHSRSDAALRALATEITGGYGFPQKVIQQLEIFETIFMMGDLFNFARAHPQLSAREALTNIVAVQHRERNARSPHTTVLPNGGPPPPPHQHPPGPSPAMTNSPLPSTPHPHEMVAQHSHQGQQTSSGSQHLPPPPGGSEKSNASSSAVVVVNNSLNGGSANTSPGNQTNRDGAKRRRASTSVKEEDALGGGPVVKQSPRVGGTKRLKV